MNQLMETANSRTESCYEDHVPHHDAQFEIAASPSVELSCELDDGLRNQSDRNLLVTVLMPCLNESRTLAACIQQAHAGCKAALAKRDFCSAAPGEQSTSQASAYEILIADNGSTDGSPEIAKNEGARVVHVQQKGYGAALLGGIAAAKSKYIVMGDSDCSYDFGETPRFIERLEQGYDLVMGNRFAGEIKPGAMPWHHRYIGNPVLSGLGRLLFRTPCRDWHCGLRAFSREKIAELQLRSPGMELASEMVLRAAQQELAMAEIAIALHPDGRAGSGHLRSIRDGWRHLSLILSSFVGNRRVFQS